MRSDRGLYSGDRDDEPSREWQTSPCENRALVGPRKSRVGGVEVGESPNGQEPSRHTKFVRGEKVAEHMKQVSYEYRAGRADAALELGP